MHPAPSVILFTVLSGLGFGLLTFLGLGVPDISGWVAFVFFLIAFALAVGGLLASTFHLGNPQRAMKAFTQWRTSWLSREGWLAVGALVVMGVYAFCVIFLDQKIEPLGWVGAALSVATVYATSMIYGQLKTIPRWNNPLTSLYFLSTSIAGGALLAGQARLAALLLALVGAVQVITWIKGDTRFGERGHSIETATGLGSIGKVRLFEAPHSGPNYLLKEFVFVVGRKHALKLRIIALVFMSILPVLLLLLPVGHAIAAVAVLSHLFGTLVSRWLFFAEAEHVVGLYYGKR
ncbi:dimethyl sulfoxide reductase anchor subunit family protein [Pseudohalocynthiibacter aestuariivivens]|jgi:sulfite dehydrogenase (quinone) subunit SoeC|uniref:Dimethyl sulfoxide reductase anchor subunit family protein n=1 Tax=Pseudohalocynthiibacter aestuariivivens TaxID=1591409 RepID=A0ABV5JJL5_9RHOB|nr:MULTISPECIES: DmsC/YnfH family molybdoenzyme membrane anchor subunit [Pseudohalocynthiibacter]MBS9717385.1 dimethyl sulfoxide reductase anchor subunit [Pseudohalocynthiibacter aestuariivivens]MCK0102281.1 dimethyl sulfoxide reductase anchor subunit [Pseudohalocynthiibacter sp. F2068]